MQETATAAGRGLGAAVDRALQIALPTIFGVGAAYWYGVLQVVGIHYVFLLGAQDLLVVSVLILPAFGLMWLFSVGLNWSQRDSTQKDRSYLYGAALRKADGTWEATKSGIPRNLVSGFLALVVGGFVYCLLEPRNFVALTIVFFSVPMVGLALGEYGAYRRDRFGDGPRTIVTMTAVLLGMVSYLVGALLTLRAEGESPRGELHVSLSDQASPIRATGLHKLSEYLLLYDRESEQWRAIRAEEVLAISPAPANQPEP